MQCFLPSGYFSLGYDAGATEREKQEKNKKKKKEKSKRHDLLGPANIAKFGSHFSPTKGTFSLSKQGGDRSRKREWMQGHHGPLQCPVTAGSHAGQGDREHLGGERVAMWLPCRAGGSQGMSE